MRALLFFAYYLSRRKAAMSACVGICNRLFNSFHRSKAPPITMRVFESRLSYSRLTFMPSADLLVFFVAVAELTSGVASSMALDSPTRSLPDVYHTLHHFLCRCVLSRQCTVVFYTVDVPVRSMVQQNCHQTSSPELRLAAARSALPDAR